MDSSQSRTSNKLKDAIQMHSGKDVPAIAALVPQVE
jgi:hypothetical protein